MERDRRAALEIELDKRSEVQSAADYRVSLCAEIENAVCSRQMLLDTVEHFEQFSMSAVIAELQSSCPEVYKLSEECKGWRSTRRRVERCNSNLHSFERTVCKGEGLAVNDQSDASG